MTDSSDEFDSGYQAPTQLTPDGVDGALVKPSYSGSRHSNDFGIADPSSGNGTALVVDDGKGSSLEERLDEKLLAENPYIFDLYWNSCFEGDPIRCTFTMYHKVFHVRCRHLIILFWITMFIVCAIIGPNLFQHLSLDISAPKNSKGRKARHKFHRHFTGVIGSSYTVIYLRLADPNTNVTYNTSQAILTYSILSPRYPLRNISNDFQADLKDFLDRNDYTFVTNYSDYYTTDAFCDSYRRNITVDLYKQCKGGAVQAYVGGEYDEASIFRVEYDSDDLNAFSKKTDWRDFIDDECSHLQKKYNREIIIKGTDGDSLLLDSQEASSASVETDLYMLPFILVVFGYTVNSSRVLIMPLVSVLICVAVSFTLLLPFSAILAVSTITPPVMTTLSLAMSLDYSLFLLVRMGEELGMERQSMRKSTMIAAVKRTMRFSGEVIILSGIILSLSLIAFLFCPVEWLKTFGLGCGFSVLTALSINMTFMPSLMMTFPGFLSYLSPKCWDCTRTDIIDDLSEEVMLPRKSRGSFDGSFDDSSTSQFEETLRDFDSDEDITGTRMSASQNGISSAIVTSAGTELASLGSTPDGHMGNGVTSTNHSHHSMDEPEVPRRTSIFGRYDVDTVSNDPLDPWPLSDAEAGIFNKFWYQCAIWITMWPLSLIVIVVVYAIIMPIGLETLNFKVQYGQNLLYPRNSEHYETFKHLSADFGAGAMRPFYFYMPLDIDEESVFNLSYLERTSGILKKIRAGNKEGSTDYILSYSGVMVIGGEYINNQSQYEKYVINASSFYHAIVDDKVGKGNLVSYVQVVTQTDPAGLKSKRLVSQLRDDLNRECGSECLLYGSTIEYVDAITELYKVFPLIMGCSFCVIFLLSGLFFSNPVLPVRLFMTISIPLSLIYGLTTMVYSDGIFGFFHAAAVKDTTGVAWVTPVMTTSVLVGLSLDYDIFLFSRINEYMLAGISKRISIVRGVTVTGNIITAAGIIMVFSFVGLLFSEVNGACQAGFMFVVSIFIDTFIIRTLLVPSILSIDRNLLWVPGWQEKFYSLIGRKQDSHAQSLLVN